MSVKTKYRKERYIRQLKNINGWSFQVRFQNTKRTFSEKQYGDPRIAFNKAIQFRNNLLNKQEVFLTPFNITIYEVMLESFELLVVRKKTQLNHISLFNHYIKDKITLNNFTESFVYSKLNAMVEIASDETINRVYNLFKRIDKTCLIKKYYERSVISSIVCPISHLRSSRTLKEPINKQQFMELLSFCNELKIDHDKKMIPLLLEFMYETGCRPCEVWCLTWNDVSEDHISINKEVGSNNSSLGQIRTTKTPLSNRLIPLTIKLKTILNKAKNGSKLIFPDSYGNMYDTDNVGQKLKNICKRHNIDFHLYDLRHRFATDLTLNNVDDRTKMELMGHKYISMTLDYARSNDEKKKEAMEKR